MSGVSVSETTPEAMMAMMIVMANSWKVRPMRPGMKTSGRKTAARESVIDKMVKLISLAPWKVASSAVSPASIRRTAFSRKTMASSTRKPMERVKASSERLSTL